MRSRLLGLLGCMLAVGAPNAARAVPVAWTGNGDGTSWNGAANWNPAVVPDNGATTYEVSIGGAPSVVVEGGFRIDSLSLGSTASLVIGEGDFLGFNADSINDGTIRLQDGPVAGNATLRFEGVVRLGGAGQVLFESPYTNQVGPLQGGHALTIGAQQRLATSGAGTQGFLSGVVVNEGTIDANGGRIGLSGPDKTNLGLMRARSGGTLALSGFTLANSGGLVDLDATGVLELDGRISGGVIGGGGRILPGLPGELAGVTLAGANVEIRDNQILDVLGGTLTNDGTIRLLDDPNIPGLSVWLRTRDSVLLGGAGRVVFGTPGNNQIGAFSGSTLTVGPSQTITTSHGGVGTISSPLTNQGTLESDGGSIVLSGAGKTNTGLMRARNGGTLTLSGFTLNNAGANLELADLGSTLHLLGAQISGGTIRGPGVLRPGLPGELLNVSLDGANVEIRDNQALDVLGGTLTNDGTIRLLDDPNIPGLSVWLRTRDSVLLGGAGRVVFGTPGNNQIGAFSGSTLTVGPSQTITTSHGGVGTISSPLTNQGTLDADGGSIVLSGAGKTNTGLMRARNGGTLTLSSFTLSNDAGVISLVSNGSLNLIGARIAGGTIQGSGVLRPGMPGELVDVALEGATVEIRDNQTLDILGGTLTNDGTIRLLDDPAITGLAAWLRTRDAVLLEGTGSVVFGTGGANQIVGFPGSTLSIGAGQTVKTGGPGTAGAIGVPLVNLGGIDADGGVLTISGPLTHHGLLQASNGGLLDVGVDVTGSGRWNAAGGRLRIAAGRTVTTSGDVLILAGGELDLLGPRMGGATFLVDAGGVLDVDGTLAATAGLDVRLTDAAGWEWGPASGLEIANASGAPPGEWQDWAFIEAGGADEGPGGSFSNANLWLPRLVVGPQGRVFLSDEFDNGNRGAGSAPEALYVGSLVFSDASGQLDLNGLNLYYQSLTGDPAQIVDVPVPPDRDRDGIENALDNCPYWPSTEQGDADENGIGNVCECGDQNEDGRVDVRDLVAINLAIFGAVPVSPLCDTGNDGLCNVADIVGANYKIFGNPAYCSRYPLPAP